MIRGMPSPVITLDSEPFWKGCQEGRFIIQKCEQCASLRWPPGPMCPECQSTNWVSLNASGGGSLYSWVIVTHPTHPAIADQVPYIVGMIELDEGIRVVGNVLGIDPKDVMAGLRVALIFEETDSGFKIPNFVSAPPSDVGGD